MAVGGGEYHTGDGDGGYHIAVGGGGYHTGVGDGGYQIAVGDGGYHIGVGDGGYHIGVGDGGYHIGVGDGGYEIGVANGVQDGAAITGGAAVDGSDGRGSGVLALGGGTDGLVGSGAGVDVTGSGMDVNVAQAAPNIGVGAGWHATSNTTINSATHRPAHRHERIPPRCEYGGLPPVRPSRCGMWPFIPVRPFPRPCVSTGSPLVPWRGVRKGGLPPAVAHCFPWSRFCWRRATRFQIPVGDAG